MNIIFILAILFLVVAIFVLIAPSSKDVQELHEITKAKRSLKSNARSRKQTRLGKLFHQTAIMLKSTGKGGIYQVIFKSICLMALGIFIALFLSNWFLMPVLGVIGFLIPVFMVRVSYINYKDLVLEELEPTLSAITTSYERCNNIVQAFEENLPYIQRPIKPVFERFVHTVKHVNPNIKTAIEEMKSEIDHSVFIEWCDALKHCTDDQTLKHTLEPIVKKLLEIKIVSGDLKNILYSSLRTYYVMLVLTIILMVISLWLFPMMLDLTLPDIVKNILVAINAFCMVFSTWKVYIETRDIETDV